jgi:predicted nucleic acid-binding protein
VIYLDTSYIVKCYLREPGTRQILGWLQGRSGLTCCLHGRLELFAAVHRHVREKRLRRRDASRSLGLLAEDEQAGLWNWVPVTGELVRDACEQVSSLRSSVCLRAADALHLACAAECGLREIYSHDRHLLAAAEHFGLAGRDILAT